LVRLAVCGGDRGHALAEVGDRAGGLSLTSSRLTEKNASGSTGFHAALEGVFGWHP